MEETLKRKHEEERLRQAIASAQNKKQLASQKIKSQLQSYKALKGDASGRGGEKPDSDAASAAENKSLSPLELLRHYTMNGVGPRMADGLVWFGENIAFPPDTRTNFKATPKFDSDMEYYTLQTLIYFLQNKGKDHSLYIRGALAANVAVVRKPDRDNLLEYLRGDKGWVPNLTKDTHR